MQAPRMDAVVVPGGDAEVVRQPGDEIHLLAVEHGEVEVVEHLLMDREGLTPHVHPWDEVQVVIEGEVEFLVGGAWQRGGPGTVQLLPRGAPHSVRVPEGSARVVMVSVGAPYADFARATAAAVARGADAETIADIAARFGVRPG
jgi:quercetin dioxygenase-like cupin family protein